MRWDAQRHRDEQVWGYRDPKHDSHDGRIIALRSLDGVLHFYHSGDLPRRLGGTNKNRALFGPEREGIQEIRACPDDFPPLDEIDAATERTIQDLRKQYASPAPPDFSLMSAEDMFVDANGNTIRVEKQPRFVAHNYAVKDNVEAAQFPYIGAAVDEEAARAGYAAMIAAADEPLPQESFHAHSHAVKAEYWCERALIAEDKAEAMLDERNASSRIAIACLLVGALTGYTLSLIWVALT